MGEAIARLREAALASRRQSDESFSYLRWEVEAWSSKRFCLHCRSLLRDFEAGRVSPLRYARELAKARDSAERRALLDTNGQKLFAIVEWLPPSMQATTPSIKQAADLAAKEALRWASLFPVVEARVRALQRATAMLTKPAKASTKYGKALARWQNRFDELAPFVEEPPAAAGTSTSEKQTGSKSKKRRDRKGIGGRPEKFTMKFIREVFNARRRDEKHAAKAGSSPLPRFPQWLSDYCSGKDIDIGKMFPPKTPGEAWSIRANRFWKAAKKRLRPAGN